MATADNRRPNLYITADMIGAPTGGGKVTVNELAALERMPGGCEAWSFPDAERPWSADVKAWQRLVALRSYRPVRAHFYSGTFTKTITELKQRGTKVSYTAAAHDIGKSRAEHEALGVPFDYPHLTDPAQFKEYVRGYLLADTVVCPSPLSAEVMRSYGCQNVVVIPHGFDRPHAEIRPIPDKRFTVGYLGQPGPDKGLRYLLEAWSLWSGRKASNTARLVIAGRGTLALLPMARQLVKHGTVEIWGEVESPSDLYSACCLYVQPSATEGFGCEVIEAQAHNRFVVCSQGAGACVHATCSVPACDPATLAVAIDTNYSRWKHDPEILSVHYSRVGHLEWPTIQTRYVEEVFTR